MVKGGPLPGEQERDTDDRWIKEGYVTLTVLGYDCGVYFGEPIAEKEFLPTEYKPGAAGRRGKP